MLFYKLDYLNNTEGFCSTASGRRPPPRAIRAPAHAHYLNKFGSFRFGRSLSGTEKEAHTRHFRLYTHSRTLPVPARIFTCVFRGLQNPPCVRSAPTSHDYLPPFDRFLYVCTISYNGGVVATICVVITLFDERRVETASNCCRNETKNRDSCSRLRASAPAASGE